MTAGDADPLWAWFDRQAPCAKRRAAHRLAILEEIGELTAAGAGKTIAVRVAAARHGVSASSVYSWSAAVRGVDRRHWLPSLAPRFKGGGRPATIEREAWRTVLADYLSSDLPSFAACYHRLRKGYALSAKVALSSSRTMRRHLEGEIDRELTERLFAALRQCTPDRRVHFDPT